MIQILWCTAGEGDKRCAIRNEKDMITDLCIFKTGLNDNRTVFVTPCCAIMLTT